MPTAATNSVIVQRDDVAALIGVKPKTLPKGHIVAAGPAKIAWSLIDMYDRVQKRNSMGAAYVWLDDRGQKTFEVRVADKDKDQGGVRYQELTYDAQGNVATRFDVLDDGRENFFRYHDNGKVSYERHAQTANNRLRTHAHYDRNGELHNQSGLAKYTRNTYGDIFDPVYAIHGTIYNRKAFEAHPDYQKEKSLFGRIGGFLKDMLGAAPSEEKQAYADADAQAEKPAVLPVETVIALVQGLSPEDRSKVFESCGDTFNNAAVRSSPRGQSAPAAQAAAVRTHNR